MLALLIILLRGDKESGGFGAILLPFTGGDGFPSRPFVHDGVSEDCVVLRCVTTKALEIEGGH